MPPASISWPLGCLKLILGLIQLNCLILWEEAQKSLAICLWRHSKHNSDVLTPRLGASPTSHVYLGRQSPLREGSRLTPGREQMEFSDTISVNP